MERTEPEQALLAAARAAGFGVRLHAGATPGADLRHGDTVVGVELVWAPRLRPEGLPGLSDASSTRPVVLATRHLDRALLQAASMQAASVVDLAGNAHLDLPGLLVHVEGRAPARARRGRPTQLGANTARLIRALLARDEPHVLDTRRKLAHTSGLALGTLQRQVAALAEQGWVDAHAGLTLVDPERLLRAWEHLYAALLRPTLVLGGARPVGRDVGAWLASLPANAVPEGLFIGGAGGAMLRGADVIAGSATLHVAEHVDPRAVPRLLSAVGLLPDAGGPIPVLRLPGAAIWAAPFVDDALLLGELDLGGEARLEAVRAKLRERILAPLLGGVEL